MLSDYDKLSISYGHPCLSLSQDQPRFNLKNRQDSHSGAGILTFRHFQHQGLLGAVPRADND